MLFFQDHLFELLQLKINVVNSEFYVSEIVFFAFHRFSVNACGSVVCSGDN